jgi:hypothetical protein
MPFAPPLGHRSEEIPMRHRTFRVVLPLLAAFLVVQGARAEPPGAATGASPRPVAVVLSQPVDASEIEPRPEVARERGAALDAEAFAQWQLQARARQLAALVQARLLDAYAKRFRLEPTEDELRPILRPMEDIPSQVEESMRQFRQKRRAEIQKKLEAPDLDPAERARLTAELAQVERPSTISKAEILAGNRKFASTLVQSWKVQRSLYRRYGGRVLLSSFGTHVAVDAMKRFLQEEEKRGSFEIHDPGLRAAFWAAVAEETWADGVVTGRSADEVFAAPPWRAKERRR